jgi:iron complex outermembrane receptor protein
LAQDEIESTEVEAEVADVVESADANASVEEVVVTGSRLKRSTFTSISPLQIISADISREAGLMNAADILQTSTSAGGQQIDLTFSGFVLDNGPGSRTVNLRGLGAARTLLMINGRRMAPSGVEGAPYAPDSGIIPRGLVAQYDVLTDGASSVYGSDAIGGVTNVILKQDFDGLRIELNGTKPKYSGADNRNVSITWGETYDKGFVGFGLDYAEQTHATYGSRPWMAECRKNYEIDSEGHYRTTDLYYAVTYGMKQTDCVPTALAGRTYIGAIDSGSIYYTPGFSNGGWINFTEPVSPFGGFGIDTDGDGLADASYSDYSLNGTEYGQTGHLYPDNEDYTVMTYGEYNLGGDANITAYFEVMYTSAEDSQQGSPPQLFPDVPAMNPYNLCNPMAENGVDCGLAQDALYTNPVYIAGFGATYEGLCASYGIPLAGCTPATFGLLYGAIGAVPTLPIVSVVGDRSTRVRELETTRVVAGFNGDLPFMNSGSLANWTFDAYASYSKSAGYSARYGIRGDRLDLALGNYSIMNIPCQNDLGIAMEDDVAPGCVAVNMYAPSLYEGVVGDFATQAERDYLFDAREFDTDYEQTIFGATMAGDLYELPGGSVQASIGVEYRKDEITSMPDAVARDGLFFGYFSDGGAVGEKDMKEVFVEIEAPLLAGKSLAKELTLNVSSRLTDDEIYGSNTTESVKIGWRPVNSLLIRGTYGTAYRSPNLRELFLMNQTGFGFISDPCYAPEEAIDLFTGEYNSENDPREQQVLDNCFANGVDPTVATGFSSYSVEQAAGGSLTLDPETSDSWTAGFSWDQEFSNEFDFAVSSTYYEVDIDNTIVEPSGQYVVNDCYGSLTGNSPFCERITRNLSNPADPYITLLDRGFLNRDNEKARGVDVNLNFSDVLTIAGKPYDLAVDIRGTRVIERSTLFITDTGEEDFNEYQGQWGYAKWKANSYVTLEWDQYRILWTTRYISDVDQNPLGIDPYSDIYDTNATGTYGDTCEGEAYADLTCRDVGFADDYFVHSLSLTYEEDNYAMTVGATNILNEEPPKVDGTEITSVNNAAIGYGYDMLGRVMYVNLGYKF